MSNSARSPAPVLKDHPGYYDVICGRGRRFQEHSGNIRMHKIIALLKERYKVADNIEKRRMVFEAIRMIKDIPLAGNPDHHDAIPGSSTTRAAEQTSTQAATLPRQTAQVSARFLKRITVGKSDSGLIFQWGDESSESVFKKVQHVLRSKRGDTKYALPAPEDVRLVQEADSSAAVRHATTASDEIVATRIHGQNHDRQAHHGWQYRQQQLPLQQPRTAALLLEDHHSSNNNNNRDHDQQSRSVARTYYYEDTEYQHYYHQYPHDDETRSPSASYTSRGNQKPAPRIRPSHPPSPKHDDANYIPEQAESLQSHDQALGDKKHGRFHDEFVPPRCKSLRKSTRQPCFSDVGTERTKEVNLGFGFGDVHTSKERPSIDDYHNGEGPASKNDSSNYYTKTDPMYDYGSAFQSYAAHPPLPSLQLAEEAAATDQRNDRNIETYEPLPYLPSEEPADISYPNNLAGSLLEETQDDEKV